MKNKLLLLTALALTLAGCVPLGTRPGSPTGGDSQLGGPVPDPPPLQLISDRSAVPPLPPSTHIIVGLCPATGSYSAMGVDTQAKRFTFLISGTEATRQQALQQFFAARIPVTFYTTLTQLQTGGSDQGMAYNPCLGLESGMPRIGSSQSVVAQVAEDPPPTPRPTGGDRTNLLAFQHLSWRTAFALDPVSHPVSSNGGSAF